MLGKLKTVRWKFVGSILFSVALIVLVVILVNVVLDDRRLTQLETIAENYAQTESIDQAGEKVLADAYWRRNLDVAADEIFGPDGLLGIFGPREHFSRHGQAEGRAWGP